MKYECVLIFVFISLVFSGCGGAASEDAGKPAEPGQSSLNWDDTNWDKTNWR